MEILVAPNTAKPQHDLTIFLGGGITNCPDWQKEVIRQLKFGDFTIFNPRRPVFPMGDQKEGAIQIAWEYERLKNADINVYWFCKETLCPATLIEFGESLGRGDTIIVGIDPGYERAFDIIERLRLANPIAHDQMVHTLEDLTQRILKAVGDLTTARRFCSSPADKVKPMHSKTAGTQ